MSAEVVLTPSREYLESKEMLSVVQQALEALSRECARRGSQQDPRHRVNAIDWLATWLMRNNPSHNAETRAKLAARKNNPKFAIGAGIRGGSEVPAGAADAGAVVGAGDGPSTLVKITLNDGGRARVAIQHELPESGGKGPESGGKGPESGGKGMARRMRPRHGDGNGEEEPIERKLRLGHLLSAEEMDRAAALIQGAAASAAGGANAAELDQAAALIQGVALSASEAELDRAATLLQTAAMSAMGPNAADLNAAAALIQSAAASAVGPNAAGPNAADLNAAAALIQSAAASAVGPNAAGPNAADLNAAAALIQSAAASAVGPNAAGPNAADLNAAAALIQGAAASAAVRANAAELQKAAALIQGAAASAQRPV